MHQFQRYRYCQGVLHCGHSPSPLGLDRGSVGKAKACERGGRATATLKAAVVIALWMALCIVGTVHPALAKGNGGRTVAYSFDDHTLLLPSQKRGALAYISDAVPKKVPVPLVVFLHGLNQRKRMHPWLNWGANDLRRRLETWFARGAIQPLVFAAPSQTIHATKGATLWPEFDLDAFVDATDAALAKSWSIDRASIVVVGHSGAGCNQEGGLASIAAGRGSIRPLAIIAIDVCMDEDSAAALAEAPDDTPVHVYWQESSWARPFERFRSVFENNRSDLALEADVFEGLSVQARHPHRAVVPLALKRALRQLLPGTPAR